MQIVNYQPQLRLLKICFVTYCLRVKLHIAYFLRDIKAKYRQTPFGYAWAFIPRIVVAYGLVEAAKAIVANDAEDNTPALTVGDVVMQINQCYFRPTEMETLLGDPTKVKEKLGWVPEITVQEMCREMVLNDLSEAKQHALLKANVFNVRALCNFKERTLFNERLLIYLRISF